MKAQLLVARTDRSALVALKTSEPAFGPQDMRNIAGAALEEPSDVLGLTKVHKTAQDGTINRRGELIF